MGPMKTLDFLIHDPFHGNSKIFWSRSQWDIGAYEGTDIIEFLSHDCGTNVHDLEVDNNWK